MKVRVPPNCKGIDVHDGTRYDARNGIVDIDNPSHARQYRRTDMATQYGAAATHVPVEGPDPEPPAGAMICTSCGYEPWAWTGPCPRCDSPLVRKDLS